MRKEAEQFHLKFNLKAGQKKSQFIRLFAGIST